MSHQQFAITRRNASFTEDEVEAVKAHPDFRTAGLGKNSRELRVIFADAAPRQNAGVALVTVAEALAFDGDKRAVMSELSGSVVSAK
jgi:hypothetical protein